MAIGKTIRINRLFSHPSGHLCSIAVDHYIGYDLGLPEGLRRIKPTLAAIAEAAPDAVTMHKGIATSAWEPYAGRIPMILQSTLARVDDSAWELATTPEEAVRLGADGFAFALFVRGASEAAHLRLLTDCVREAARFDMPVICHIYPRDFSGMPKVSYKPEDIAWAVRCAVESGADIVKVPYCGDVSAYAEIVSDCPVPLVAAGGPKTDTFKGALEMISAVMQAGARGATIGRNVWGFSAITPAVRAFKAVIHDGSTPEDALRAQGLN
jgi:class I fructose-bisphosphate aldolase